MFLCIMSSKSILITFDITAKKEWDKKLTSPLKWGVVIVIGIFQELCSNMIFEGLMSVSIMKLQLLWSRLSYYLIKDLLKKSII